MVINPQTLRGIYVAFNTIFNKALTEVQPLYTEIASVIPSTTDSETYAWLGDIPGMTARDALLPAVTKHDDVDL